MTQAVMIDTRTYLEAAAQIGRDLYREAIWDGPRCNWTGWSVEAVGTEFKPVYRAMSANLYMGSMGIALFLDLLHRQTGEAVFEELFQGALAHVRSALDSNAIVTPDYYSGSTGIGHQLVRLGEVRQEQPLIDEGLAVLRNFDLEAFHETSLDLMSGPAGVIPALIEVGLNHDCETLLDDAVACGELLLTKAVESADGISWPGTMERRHLTGLSHGTAGFALAFFELNAVRPDHRYQNAAKGALRYERRHFDADQGGWPDFRVDVTNPKAAHMPAMCPIAWCHGAGGIGFSRLRILELVPEQRDVILPELDQAIQAVTRYLTTSVPQDQLDYGLCHGVFGNAELLLETSLRFERADMRQVVDQAAQNGIAQYHQRGMPWPCVAQANGQTPGLMLGLAGIGYHLLRLHDPQSVPSILIPQVIAKEPRI